MDLNKYDKEVVDQMAQLLGKGFMIFPIDPDLKAKYYATCEHNNKNPHDLVREDMGKRIVIMIKREAKQKQEEKDRQARSFLSRTAEQARKEKGTQPEVKKRKDD